MALNQNAAAGLVSMIGPCHGGRISHAQRAAQDEGGDASKLPDYLFKEAEPETMSCSAACSSRHSGLWIQAEFDGIEATGTSG